MKDKYSLLLLFFLLCASIFGQSNITSAKKGDTIYYDKHGRKAVKAKATQFGVIQSILNVKPKILFRIKLFGLTGDYANKLKADTNIERLEIVHYLGNSIDYHPNGEKSKQASIDKTKESYSRFYWYPDGSKMKEILVYNTKPLQIIKPNEVKNYWDDKGVQQVIDGNGNYAYYSGTDSIYHSGKVLGGIKDGGWKGTYKNGSKYYIEEYKNAKLVKGTSWDREGETYKYTQEYVPAKYIGGQAAIADFLRKRFKVPKSAMDAKVDGTILITFFINLDGKISGLKVIRKVHPDADKAALKTLSKMTKWKPGEFRGRKIRTRFSLPVTYIIE